MLSLKLCNARIGSTAAGIHAVNEQEEHETGSRKLCHTTTLPKTGSTVPPYFSCCGTPDCRICVGPKSMQKVTENAGARYHSRSQALGAACAWRLQLLHGELPENGDDCASSCEVDALACAPSCCSSCSVGTSPGEGGSRVPGGSRTASWWLPHKASRKGAVAAAASCVQIISSRCHNARGGRHTHSALPMSKE